MWVGSVVLLLLAASAASATDLDVYSLHVRSDIQLRFATTLITSRVANLANYSNEAVFRVVLPEEAFISNFTMEIDGVVYPGVVNERAAAQRKYQRAKKKGKSTGLVSNEPRDSKKFKVQVNVAALSKVTFNLTYQELLKRTLGVYQHKIFIKPGQPVRDLTINVAIQESRNITTLHVPPILVDVNSYKNDLATALNRFAVITRPSPRSAFITYAPTLAQQKLESATGLSGHFVVEYDIQRSLDAGDLLVVNGYFVHFLAPVVQHPVINDVIFILDMSGSMYGEKIRQLKAAMLQILDDLKEGDRFNIMKFTHTTKLYKDDMVDVTPETIRRAKKYVGNLKASGSTNINEALLEGLKLFKRSGSERSPLLVFLTDGLPSTGVTDNTRILQNVMEENQEKVPIFSLAFGKDADWGLVKTVAIQNDGFGRKIYQDSDASLQISGFYDEVAVTLLNDVSIEYLGDVVEKETLTKSRFKSFFNGSEMVVAGRLQDPATRSLDIEVFGDGAKGNLVLSMTKEEGQFNFDDTTGLMEISDIEEITEKLWAYLTIKQLLENADGELNATAKDEYKQRALDLSLNYGFVTPLTSMVVTKPEDDEEDENRPTTTPAPTTKRPRRYYGGGGGGYGGGGGGDPHYMVRIRGIEHPICFDVSTKAGEIHNLITDPAHGITINTLIITSGSLDKNGEQKTYIGQVSIQLQHHGIVVIPDAVFFDTKMFEWVEEFTKHFGGSHLTFINGGNTLSIRLKFGPEILIKRSAHHQPESGKVDYLNVYVKDEDYFSKRTSGLIGQFVNGHKHILMKKEHIQGGGKLMAKFQVKERPSNSSEVPDPKPERYVVRGNLVKRSEVVEKGTELCWMIHKEYEELLLGKHNHFLADVFIKQNV